jgi:hypothetical protein
MGPSCRSKVNTRRSLTNRTKLWFAILLITSNRMTPCRQDGHFVSFPKQVE